MITDTLTPIMLGAAGLLSIRNGLTFFWQGRSIKEAHRLATKAIERGDGRFLDYYDQIPSYWSELFDFTRWAYKSPFIKGEKK